MLRLDRPLSASGGGRSTRPGQSGGTYYPTVLEAYSRDSDFRRWQAGAALWFGSGPSWADQHRTYLVRSFRDFGCLPGPQANEVTLFPGRSSPSGAWSTVNRRRGAVILPQPLLAEDISLQTTAPVESAHRLVLDVSDTLTPAQLEHWRGFIGDQFEDSATGPESLPRPLPETTEAVAYTLAEVDAAAGRLLFDLSRPYLRSRVNDFTERMQWRKARYDSSAIPRWRDDGSRFLCNSHRLVCDCPDYSGARTANLLGGGRGSQQLFPRPGAGRTLSGRWEAESAGYRARWRDPSDRADQRRECKHIHAVRWALGCPFYEASEYPLDEDDRLFSGGRQEMSGAQIQRYQALRELALDQLVVPLASSAAVIVDYRDTVPEDEDAPTEAGRRPILWTTLREPPKGRARIDDWWLQRGTERLRIFDPALERFVDTMLVGGSRRPFIESWPAGELAPPEVRG
jgi:hypothetical protein